MLSTYSTLHFTPHYIYRLYITPCNTTTTSLSTRSQGHSNPWENSANDDDSAFFSRQEHEEELLLTTNTNTITVFDELLPPSTSRNSMSFGTKFTIVDSCGECDLWHWFGAPLSRSTSGTAFVSTRKEVTSVGTFKTKANLQ